MPFPRPYTLPFGQTDTFRAETFRASIVPFTFIGAIGTGALGAGIGALAAKKRGRGALIGAAIGGAVGGVGTFLVLKMMEDVAGAAEGSDFDKVPAPSFPEFPR